MDYTLSFSFDMHGDVVPLAKVSETMARRKTIGSGAIPWHKKTYSAMNQEYQDLLLAAATNGGLVVCDQFGRGGAISDIVGADPMVKLNEKREVVLPEICSLYVKAHHLNQWAATNGDTFKIEDTGVEVFKLKDGYGCLELPRAPTDASPASVVAVINAPAPLTTAPAWSLITSPARTPGYRWALYRFLQAEHVAGKPCPKAQDVLDAWKLNPPLDMAVVQVGRFSALEYQLDHGSKKKADLKAVQAAIRGLIVRIEAE